MPVWNGWRPVKMALRDGPQSGAALAWWHSFPNGTADPAMWHAGCIGRAGNGRLAVQKFKTPLDADVATRLEQDARSFQQRMVSEAERLTRRRAAVDARGGAAAAMLSPEEHVEPGAEDAFDHDTFWARTEQAMDRMFE